MLPVGYWSELQRFTSMVNVRHDFYNAVIHVHFVLEVFVVDQGQVSEEVFASFYVGSVTDEAFSVDLLRFQLLPAFRI